MDNTRKGFKLTPTDKDKRIEELEAQIEKMKCCNNCALYQCEKWNSGEVNYHYEKCDKWEMVE